MKKIVCVFCNKKGERAKEHVWPDWLQKSLNLSTEKFLGTHYNLAGIPLSERVHVGDATQFGHVCKNCNSGWMSKLEVEFQKIFNAISENDNFFINGNSARIIKLWSIKTAFIINAFSNYRKIIPVEHFNKFFLKQKIKTIKIYLAKNIEEKTLRWQQGQNFFFITKMNKDKLRTSYFVSLLVGKIIIKIIYIPDNNFEFISDDYKQIFPYKKGLFFSGLKEKTIPDFNEIMEINLMKK